jgi:hypothetical protein
MPIYLNQCIKIRNDLTYIQEDAFHHDSRVQFPDCHHAFTHLYYKKFFRNAEM